MELTLNSFGELSGKGSVQLSEVAFGQEFNEGLVHQVVVAYMAKGRAGTKAQKTRSEVSGGGAKPFKQKGTGRARAGTTRSPLWRTGGVTFAAAPRDYSQKVNRKMYRSAIRSIFSELVRQERLVAVQDFDLESHKTKDLLGKLKAMGVEDALIVTENVSDNLYLASRNLININVRDVAAIDPVSLVGHEKVVMTESAIKKVEEWLA